MRGWGKKYAKILGIQIQTTISLYSRYPYRFIRCQSMASLRKQDVVLISIFQMLNLRCNFNNRYINGSSSEKTTSKSQLLVYAMLLPAFVQLRYGCLV